MIIFSDAKNGEKTCALNGRHFHSAYNPTREAEQFVSRLSAPFVPRAVVIIEPALSYCAPFLRARFSDARLCAIRLTGAFSASDSAWNTCLYAEDAHALSDALYTLLGEETLAATVFCAWQPSEQIFAEKTRTVWQEIKAAVVKGRDVLATRAFFSRRWTKNTVKFCANVRHTAIIAHGTSDIVVAASGPSLKTSLPELAARRGQFFLLAVSSALLPLMHAGIQPDLVLSTDGGFWAKKHLASAGYSTTSPPFALAAEGACPTHLLLTNTIVPLFYADGMANPFFTACKISAMGAARNGTVSGTAVEFALSLTDGNVYACGLDLASATGFQHTQPNELENTNAQNDRRTRPKETRAAAAACSSQGALTIYRDWFSAESARLGKRLYRLSADYSFAHRLGTIRDVNWEYFDAHQKPNGTLPRLIPTARGKTQTATLRQLVQDTVLSEEYTAELCPVESILQKRAATEAERAAYAETIAQKKAAFVRELEALL